MNTTNNDLKELLDQKKKNFFGGYGSRFGYRQQLNDH